MKNFQIYLVLITTLIFAPHLHAGQNNSTPRENLSVAEILNKYKSSDSRHATINDIPFIIINRSGQTNYYELYFMLEKSGFYKLVATSEQGAINYVVYVGVNK